MFLLENRILEIAVFDLWVHRWKWGLCGRVTEIWGLRKSFLLLGVQIGGATSLPPQVGIWRY